MRIGGRIVPVALAFFLVLILRPFAGFAAPTVTAVAAGLHHTLVLESDGSLWAISVFQTPGAPTLYVNHSGNTVTVYWQAVSGWTLQQNSSLANTNGWTLNSSWTTSNGTNSLILTSPTGNLFFRLSNP